MQTTGPGPYPDSKRPKPWQPTRPTPDSNVSAVNDALDEIDARLPTVEELAYLRRRMEQDARASWMWKTVKENAPWLVGILGALGSALYWFLTHTVTITGGKP